MFFSFSYQKLKQSEERNKDYANEVFYSVFGLKGDERDWVDFAHNKRNR